MEFIQQHKKAVIAVVVVAGILCLAILFQTYSSFLGARLSLQNRSETVVGGRLLRTNLSFGDHTLQFRAKTPAGEVITDTVTFTLLDSVVPPTPLPTPTPPSLPSSAAATPTITPTPTPTATPSAAPTTTPTPSPTPTSTPTTPSSQVQPPAPLPTPK